MPPVKKYRYNYVDIYIPSDCESNPLERADLAILNARERFRDWVMPANWWVVKDTGQVVRVCRKSTYHKKGA
jgi:hypothetical protein